MRRLALLLLLAGACGDNKDAPARDDAGAGSDGSGSQTLAHCLDSSEIARPPGNALPCDLLPPGFGE